MTVIPPEQIVDWWQRWKNKESISSIAQDAQKDWRVVDRNIKKYEAMVNAMPDDEEGEEEEVEEEEPSEEPVEGGGEEPVFPSIPPPVVTRPPPPQEETTVVKRFRPSPRSRKAPAQRKVSYEEAGLPDEPDEPLLKGPEAIEQRRHDKLISMLKTIPGMSKQKLEYIEMIWTEDETVRREKRLLFDVLSDIDKVDAKKARRIVDIVFSEQVGGGNDAYEPSYGEPGYDTGYNPYSGTSSRSTPYRPGYPEQPRYDNFGRPMTHRGEKVITESEMRERIEMERRIIEQEAEIKKLREQTRDRIKTEVNTAGSNLVTIKRPVRNSSGEVIDTEEVTLPRDIYFMQMEMDRNKQMLDSIERRNAAVPPKEESKEIAALTSQVDKLAQALAKKDGETALGNAKNEIQAKLDQTNAAITGMLRGVSERLQQVENSEGKGGMLSDEAQVIIAEIKGSTDLTKTALMELNKTANNAIDVYSKVAKPNKPKKEHDRSRYKEGLDDEDVRIIREEIGDETDLEEG